MPTRAGTPRRPRGTPRREATPPVPGCSSRCARAPSTPGSPGPSVRLPMRSREPAARASHVGEAGVRGRAAPHRPRPAVTARQTRAPHPPGVSQLRETPDGLVRVCQALHAVVAAVALGELGLDPCEDVRMLVDGKQNRRSHRLNLSHRSVRHRSDDSHDQHGVLREPRRPHGRCCRAPPPGDRHVGRRPGPGEVGFRLRPHPRRSRIPRADRNLEVDSHHGPPLRRPVDLGQSGGREDAAAADVDLVPADLLPGVVSIG